MTEDEIVRMDELIRGMMFGLCTAYMETKRKLERREPWEEAVKAYYLECHQALEAELTRLRNELELLKETEE